MRTQNTQFKVELYITEERMKERRKDSELKKKQNILSIQIYIGL